MRILQPICHYLRENTDLLLAILIQMHYICIWSSEKQKPLRLPPPAALAAPIMQTNT